MKNVGDDRLPLLHQNHYNHRLPQNYGSQNCPLPTPSDPRSPFNPGGWAGQAGISPEASFLWGIFSRLPVIGQGITHLFHPPVGWRVEGGLRAICVMLIPSAISGNGVTHMG